MYTSFTKERCTMLDKPNRDRKHQKKTQYDDRFNRQSKKMKGEKRTQHAWNDNREDLDAQ
jgi:hypothetical protein